MRHIKIAFLVLISWLAMSCSERVKNAIESDSLPKIYPDYLNVTIPTNIAPLNFCAANKSYERMDVTVSGRNGEPLHVNGKTATFSIDKWHELLSQNKGDSLTVCVSMKKDGQWTTYRPFAIYVSPYELDAYGLTYRRVAPGYGVYGRMGIYLRELNTFKEKAIVENTLVAGMCVNCHTQNRTNPSDISLHIRGSHGGTFLRHNGQDEILDTKTDSTISACVYPYWHPTGKYVAYSVNATRQSFHEIQDKRVEVYDMASDIVVYNTQTHALHRTPLLMKKSVCETHPAFSPDGRWLYFCVAKTPQDEDVSAFKYDLCRIAFDAKNGTFGDRIDTLICASANGRSISFPRPSYDGRYLMYTESNYGTFPIWHKEADLRMIDLKSGTIDSLAILNSDGTESYHNWSSNSHWVVFSSRREDGLHTRLYIACIDDKGHFSKPFILPQKNPREYYEELYQSYNVPDFTNAEIKINHRWLRSELMSDRRKGIQIKR